MKYLREYNKHDSYETELNGGGVDISLPNVSYCKDVKDVHYTPYNLVRFEVYLGNAPTSTQTVKIYTDLTTFDEVQVSENKWYTYILPKDKGLYRIEGSSILNIVVKANISYYYDNGSYEQGHTFIPQIRIEGEVSFKDCDTSNITSMKGMFSLEALGDNANYVDKLDLSGWNTSKVTDMSNMFSLFFVAVHPELDLSGWDMSKVTDITDMFNGCENLHKIIMKGCTTETINKIKAQLETDGITTQIITEDGIILTQ